MQILRGNTRHFELCILNFALKFVHFFRGLNCYGESSLGLKWIGSRPLSYMNNFPMEYWLNFSHVDRGKQYLIIPECEILEN